MASLTKPRKKPSVLERFVRLVYKFYFPQQVRARWWLRRWRRREMAAAPRPLILTLTSYPPRFPTLALTLKSLLLQTVTPDAVELWIAEGDVGSLPRSVRDLCRDGLLIKTCRDTRSYKKIIPSLTARPDASFVIADDDTYYWPTWLQELLAARRPGVNEVVCHRAHRITLRDDGFPRRYREWDEETDDNAASKLIFPTGIGGVLYSPGIFHQDVTREDLFMRLCPMADDIWLFWMASLNGAVFRKIGRPRTFVTWYASQKVGLLQTNQVNEDGNDRQIARLIEAYGWPGRPDDKFVEVAP